MLKTKSNVLRKEGNGGMKRNEERIPKIFSCS